ncbi:hypothetical protein BCR43DRAFT_496935 [Syncephalastrum racemosum]|uniref:Uncharacterized protein n=1 Tax=Syncephalastrum racemosum TaxID=13706 RepID=A0A1X2H4W0_SYNRA|nr:hypothetical protein BCR43DRAFT_496935 [Syncephalastrum racemosum]
MSTKESEPSPSLDNTTDDMPPQIDDDVAMADGSRPSTSSRKSLDHHSLKRRIASWIPHESDTELYIRSLTESLQIHKEIVERIEHEKEKYIEAVEEERRKERAAAEEGRAELASHQERHEVLQANYQALLTELEKKRQEYQKMEANYYNHVRQIRATDDDLSTIQSETSHLFSQISNTCMGLRSKVDRAAGTAFVFKQWPERADSIRSRLLSEGEENLDTGYLGLFLEKYIVEVIVNGLLRQPMAPGLPINDAYQQIEAWIRQRNGDWATRLRQQISSLVVKQPDDSQPALEAAQAELVDRIYDQIAHICPSINAEAQRKKLANIVNRAAKLNLAIKGQELPVQIVDDIIEGETVFDESRMKAAGKGKSEGTVLLVITPSLSATDPADAEHGFLVSAKVLCV